MAEIFNADKQIVDFPELREITKKGQYKNVFGNLLINPERVSFESQDDDEYVILMGRRHYSTNFGWMTLACMALFVPFFWGDFPMIAALSANTEMILSVAWYTGLLLFCIQNFLLWFYNVYIVTNERLVDVDFFGLLYKNINVTQINRIEDVNYSQRGLLASVFNYGDVVVQTASEQRSDDKSEGAAFNFMAISNPALVVRIISELMELSDETKK